MTLENTVLQKVAEWRHHGDRKTLHVPHAESGWNVSLTADRCDELSSLLWEVRLQRISQTGTGVSLADWAKGIAERSTGLIEQLQVHEIDAALSQALIRSNEPTQRNGDSFYYEVHLKGTAEATLRRFKVLANTSRREQTPFALTHEGLAKIARDIAHE